MIADDPRTPKIFVPDDLHRSQPGMNFSMDCLHRKRVVDVLQETAAADFSQISR
jgi:hypothetical protein